jgi:hypothetical protein
VRNGDGTIGHAAGWHEPSKLAHHLLAQQWKDNFIEVQHAVFQHCLALLGLGAARGWHRILVVPWRQHCVHDQRGEPLLVLISEEHVADVLVDVEELAQLLLDASMRTMRQPCVQHVVLTPPGAGVDHIRHNDAIAKRQIEQTKEMSYIKPTD